MTDERPKTTSTVRVQASNLSRKDPPPWMAQAVILLTAWQTWGLVDSLRSVRWGRRSKYFQAIDVVLVLLLFSLSNERSVRAFFQHLGPHADTLAALWGRDKLPKRAGFVEMLAAIDDPFLDTIRPLFCPTSPREFLPTACGG